MPETVALEVARYRPEQEREPSFDTFDVPLRKDWVVLDGLNYIKDHLDGSLTFRWSCRMAICGSCGKMVNGIPQLSCHVFLRDYYPGKVRIEPLNHFPIVRDLVIDQSDFFEKKLPSVKPYVVPKEEKPVSAGAYLQTPEQFQLAISLAVLCWNLSLAPADKRAAMVDDMLRKLVKPGESTDDVRHVMAVLIARKETLFPNDRRLITDHRVSGGPKNANIVIEYSPPEEV